MRARGRRSSECESNRGEEGDTMPLFSLCLSLFFFGWFPFSTLSVGLDCLFIPRIELPPITDLAIRPNLTAVNEENSDVGCGRGRINLDVNLSAFYSRGSPPHPTKQPPLDPIPDAHPDPTATRSQTLAQIRRRPNPRRSPRSDGSLLGAFRP